MKYDLSVKVSSERFENFLKGNGAFLPIVEACNSDRVYRLLFQVEDGGEFLLKCIFEKRDESLGVYTRCIELIAPRMGMNLQAKNCSRKFNIVCDFVKFGSSFVKLSNLYGCFKKEEFKGYNERTVGFLHKMLGFNKNGEPIKDLILTKDAAYKQAIAENNMMLWLEREGYKKPCEEDILYLGLPPMATSKELSEGLLPFYEMIHCDDKIHRSNNEEDVIDALDIFLNAWKCSNVLCEDTTQLFYFTLNIVGVTINCELRSNIDGVTVYYRKTYFDYKTNTFNDVTLISIGSFVNKYYDSMCHKDKMLCEKLGRIEQNLFCDNIIYEIPETFRRFVGNGVYRLNALGKEKICEIVERARFSLVNKQPWEPSETDREIVQLSDTTKRPKEAYLKYYDGGEDEHIPTVPIPEKYTIQGVKQSVAFELFMIAITLVKDESNSLL